MDRHVVGLVVALLAGFGCSSDRPPPTPQPTPLSPTVTTIDPTSGSAAGGTLVTVTGTNFAAGASLALGGVAATGVSVSGTTTLTATTAARAAALVDVVVTNPTGQSGTLPNGFAYVLLRANPGGPYQTLHNTPITFSGLASTSTPFAITSFSWNCGQPTAANCTQQGPTPQFVYRRTSPGNVATYTVTLTIEDARGNRDTATTSVTVTNMY